MFNQSSLKYQTAAYGGGVKPHTMPSQAQMDGVTGLSAPGGGGDMKTAMLMSMLGGGAQKGSPTTIINDMAGYENDVGIPMQQTQKTPYQQAIMQALMGGRI